MLCKEGAYNSLFILNNLTIMNTDNFSIPISPNIINAIASAYKDPYRVLLEYIINSIDASSRFFDPQSNSYSKNIEITFTHKGKKASDSEFIFEDNCEGFSRSVNESYWEYFMVGLSGKSGDTQTIGKFGVGMMTFVGICNKLKISIKEKDFENLGEIIFTTSAFNQPGLNSIPISFEEPAYTRDIKDSFTRVILSEFKPGKFKEFNFIEFKSEVELHLDQILRRKNLVIKLIDNRSKVHVCKPFDYESIEGEPFEKTLTELKYMHYKKGKKERTVSISPHTVKVFIKVTKNKIYEGRRLYFCSGGVRIDGISKFEEFRTNQKGFTWSHPNAVGYVNITGVVEPALTRDSFEPSENLKPLFYTLKKLEPEIKQYIETQMNEVKANNVKKLELELNNALKKFLEKKNQKAKETKKTNTPSKETESVKITLLNSKGEKPATTSSQNNFKGGKNHESEKREEKQNKTNEIELKIPKDDSITIDNNIDANSLFSLRIDDLNEPDKDEHNNPYRSKFTGTEVVIFQKHPAFQTKIDEANGSQKISEGLVIYLSTEIVMHYIVNYTDILSQEDSYSQKVLSEFITTVYDFESYLKELKGKDLSELDLNI